jgi:hypothetical protein
MYHGRRVRPLEAILGGGYGPSLSHPRGHLTGTTGMVRLAPVEPSAGTVLPVALEAVLPDLTPPTGWG